MSNARFSILQARAVKDKRISDSQFRTLAALGMYADENGWCFPSLKTLGDDLGKSKQAVGRDTIALRKLGYLEVSPRFRPDGSRTSSEYRLVFDTPRQRGVDTYHHELVDTPSTSEVDAINDPINEPKLTESEYKEAGDKVMRILSLSTPPKEYWKGREFFHEGHYEYADWYHGVTNQICSKRYQKSWQKAFSEWQDAELKVDHLQAAYDEDVKWRKFITDPNELTKKAIAIKASSMRSKQRGEAEVDDFGAPISY